VLNLLAQFVYLQLLDLLTTLAFLSLGLREINPLVWVLIRTAGTPAAGLLAAKGLAAALGFFCWRRRRLRLLSRANVFYAVLVVWNLVALLVHAAGLHPA